MCRAWVSKSSKHVTYEIHYYESYNDKMNVLAVREHDLDTKAEPEQKEIVNTFKIQHKPLYNAQMSPFIMVRTI